MLKCVKRLGVVCLTIWDLSVKLGSLLYSFKRCCVFVSFSWWLI